MFPCGGVDGAGLKAAGGTKNAAQLLHMQRFLAASGSAQRSTGGRGNYFGDGANFGDMELARQFQQQRSVAAAAAAAQRHWPAAGREDFGNASGAGYSSGFDFVAGMAPHQSDASRSYVFKCPDCSFNKSSCEDLEIHIKTEHLNWLPFQCPFCQQSRASDSQMREHIHSVHKKPENKYFYVDNPMAKRMLQEMIDRSLFNASRNASARNSGYSGIPFPAGGTSNGGPPFLNPFNLNSNGNYFPDESNSPRTYGSDGDGASPARKQPRLTPQAPVAQSTRRASPAASSDRHSNHSASQHSDDLGASSGGVTVVAKKLSNGDDLLAQLQQQLARQRGEDDEVAENDADGATPADGDGGNASDDGAGGNESLVLDDETSAQLSQIFGAAALANVTDGGGSGEFGASSSDASHNDVLQNLSAIFSAAAANSTISAVDALKLAESGGTDGNNNGGFSPIRFNHNNNPIRRRAPRGCGSNQSISKKRVLGECAACHKPITAGARQMHMFYHLGKDQGTYRFRCKHENCDVEHYRKDQMENHHSKVHGKIEADMMEDRSLELYDQCQKMSMDLLGTVGNTPGPTAAKAQILYDNMQREAEMAAFRKRKRNRHSSSAAIGGAPCANFLAPINNNLNYNSSNSNNLNNLTNEENNNKSNNNTVDIDFIRRIQQQLKNRTTGNNNESNAHGNRSFGGSSTNSNSNATARASGTVTSGDTPRHEECIECLRCHQTIVGRTRGFHILRHLYNDLGIVRYSCQHCDFRHDRAQSVQTHGKKEHGDEECVVDLIAYYQDDVRAMSKECFGRDQLFGAKNERRRSRIMASESQPTPSAAAILATTGFEDTKPIAPRIIIKTSPAVPSTPSTAAVAPSSASSSSAAAARRKASQRRFGIRRPKSRKQREEMAKLREVSMRLGGAQYFKKRSSESIACEICGKYNTTRLSQHAYNHLEDCSLYLCPQCNMGHCSRDIIVKHLKDFHDSIESPTDNRLRYAAEIKEMVRRCFPSCFVDAPIPTSADIERLKINLNLSDKALATFDADAGAEAGEDGHHDDEEDEVEEEDEDGNDGREDDVKPDETINEESMNDEEAVSGEEEDHQLLIADEEEEQEELGMGPNDDEEEEQPEEEELEEEQNDEEKQPGDDDELMDDDNDSLEVLAANARSLAASESNSGGAVGLETEDDY